MKSSTAKTFARYPAGRAAQHHPNGWFRLPPGVTHRQTPSFTQLRSNDATLFPSHTQPTKPSPCFQPPYLQQPIHYFPHHYNNNLPPPKLTPSIASLHNAALVYLHRGLAIHSIQRQHHKAPLASLHSQQEPFLSAVIKGFNQILLLQTGLEFSQPRQVMESLMTIVREKLNGIHHQKQDQQDELWNQSKWVIIHSALRPRMSCVGEWAWEEIRRGNFNRLIQVWSGILQVIEQKPNPLHHSQLQHQPVSTPSSSSSTSITTNKTIGLDERFFTALVTVSSTIKDGPKLSDLVESLVNRVWSRVQASDQLNLEGIVPDPHRARYFLRAVELGLLWKRPSGPNQTDPRVGEDEAREEEEDQEENERVERFVEQDERIVHLIRRTFLVQRPDAIQFCVDLSERIQEAVQGSKDEPGWLLVSWSEPPGNQPSSRENEKHPNLSNQSDAAIAKASGQIALTQKVVSILLNGFAQNGLMAEVEELIKFSRKLGGMNQYLWTSILRGLTQSKKKDLINDYLKRMKLEDGIEVDFKIRCILISASIGTSDLKGGIESIDQLISLSESESSTNDKNVQPHIKNRQQAKLPIEAINSILSALLQNKFLDKAEKLLKNLSGRIEPNATTLNHFLKYHSRLNPKTELNLESALDHLKTFEEVYSIKPDVISFTILLNILMKLGLGSNLIEKLLLMMKSMNIQPNAITYGSIIHHLCRSGKSQDVHVALNLLNYIEANGVATTEITYTALIQGFLRAHIQEYEARTQGIHLVDPQDPIQSSNHSQALNHEDRKTNLEKAIELIAKLKSRSSNSNTNATTGMTGLFDSGGGQGGKINHVIYNSLLNALFSTGEYETGFQVFKLMKSEYDLVCQQQRKNNKLDDRNYHHTPSYNNSTSINYQVHEDFNASNKNINSSSSHINYYYGNGFIDSYGIIFRRLIQFGQFDWFKLIYFDYFKFEKFDSVPLWIQKLIDKFEKSQSF